MSNLWLNPGAWDATRLRSLMLCRRRFWLEHMLQLAPNGRRSIHLDFGTAWHEAVGAYDAARVRQDPNPLNAGLRRALEASANWEPSEITTSKNRSTLVRSLVWYDEQFGPGNSLLPLTLEDQTPALELNFRFPLFSDQPNGPWLCGNLDALVEFGGEIWVLERKTTASALSGFYWSRFDPNIQIDTYAVAAHLLWPQWQVKGVMVEAHQVGVGFSRFERRMFRRSPARLEEILQAIQREVHDFECDLAADADDARAPSFASCNVDAGCPFRAYCQADPSLREWTLTTQFSRRERPWDPLAGNQQTNEGDLDAGQ